MPASFEFAEHKRLRCTGAADLSGDTYLVLILMNGTSAPSEPLITNLAAFSDLKEFDDTGYSRGTIAGQSLTVDPTTAEVVFDASDQAFGAMNGDGSDDVVALLISRDGANDGARVPAFYIDRSPAFDPGTNPYTVEWNTGGIFRV